jgi:cytochrome c peroxidase
MQKFGVHENYCKYKKSKKIYKGLSDLTKNQNDEFIFKAPGLRNIEKTFPYFHDGSVKDLREAVKIMSKIQNNKDLPQQEINDIVAFLKTLTAEIDPKYKQ